MRRLYYNGDIITMEKENEYVEALLIENGKIIATGDLNKIERIFCENIDKVDLQGKTVMPSFIDAHGHLSMVAQMSTVANLADCNDFNEVIDTLKKYIENNNIKDGQAVIGFGYDHNNLKEEKHPTKEILDKASTICPIYISHTSGHMGCANSKALELAGISRDIKGIEGGVIGRAHGTLEPNGYLEENAMKLLGTVLSSGMQLDLFKLIVESQQEYLKNGVTTVQDGAATSDILKLYSKLDSEKRLDVDVVAYPLATENTDKILEEYKDYIKEYKNNFKIGGYKLVLDGSPQGKSAWLTRPYEGEESYCGYPWMKDEVVKANIKKSIDDNQQILVHCNGDAAGDQFLRNYEEALTESTNINKNNLRPVMIHCQTVRKDQLDKMVYLNMIPSIFVAHTYYWGDTHIKNLGEHRAKKISPAKSALDNNLCINFHQDPPVTKPTMLHTIWCAVNRISKKSEVIGEEERIDVFNAMKAVTINAAYSYFEENEKGTLKVGKKADLVILDKNPLKVDNMEIKDIKVMETIKDGKTLYKENN